MWILKMRIIKEGNIPIEETQLTCGFCQTVFGYEPQDCKDIIQVNKWDREYQANVYCPLCFTKIIIPISTVYVMRYRMAGRMFS